MTSLYDLKRFIFDYIEDTSVATVATRYINQAVREAEESVPWPQLRAEKDITPDTDGEFDVPARCRVVRKITSVPDGGPSSIEYHLIDGLATEEHPRLNIYTAHYCPPSTTSVKEILVSPTQGSVTVPMAVSAESFFDSTDVGRSFRLRGHSYEYEIVSVDEEEDTMVVYPEISALSSSSITGYSDGAMRPRMRLLTPAYVPSTEQVRLYYQVSHPELYTDSSMLLIPCPRTVTLLALQYMLQTNKYNVDSDRLATSLILAKNSEIGNSGNRQRTATRRDGLFASRG